ncbi:MAG: SRPBCC family protein [Acidimicrobiales bacterium]
MGISVSKHTTINVGAGRLWTILADDFDKVGQWARAVDASAPNTAVRAPEGAEVGGRVCQTPGFGAINETFTSFDADRRSYAFRASADKIPSFVRNITNHTSVKPLGPDKSEITVEVTADTEGIRGAMVKPMMTHKFGATIDDLFEDLREFAESGQVSEGKTKALAKASR